MVATQQAWIKRKAREAEDETLRAARLEYRRQYRKKNKEKMTKSDRKAAYKKLYDMTYEEYEQMLDSQGGVCAICGNPPRRVSRLTQHLFVDHNHETGKVRGLLCNMCNLRLVIVEDKTLLNAALTYLEKY